MDRDTALCGYFAVSATAGAAAASPYGAYAAVSAFHGAADSVIDELHETYRYSAGKAMLKVMCKTGSLDWQSRRCERAADA